MMIGTRFGITNLISFKMTKALLFSKSFVKGGEDFNNKLSQKINKATNVYGILKLYQESKHNFSDVLVQASEKLANFLDSDKKYNRQSLYNFYSEIGNINIEKMTQQEIVIMLNVTRKYEILGFRGFRQQKDRFLQTFKEIIMKKSFNSTKQIDQLCHYYEVISFFQEYNINKIIFTKIYNFLSREKAEGMKIEISYKSIAKFFRGTYYIQQLSLRERVIRGTFLHKLDTQIKQLQIEDLVDICCNLLSVDQLDFQNKELIVLNRLIQKLKNQLQNLTKEEMLKLLSIQDHRINRTRLISLYKSIADRIFEIIQPDGSTKIAQSQIIDFLNLFTQKFKFNQISEVNQDKFFIFIQRYIANRQNNWQNRSIISKCLINVLKNKFLDEKHKNKFQQIVNKIDFPVNIQLIYQLSIKDFDNSHFLKVFKLPPYSKIQNTLFYGIALKFYRGSDDLKQIQNQKIKNEKEIERIFTNRQDFTKFVYSSITYQDSQDFFYQIYKHFPDILKKIENPLKAQINNYEYKVAYTQFALKTLPYQYSKISQIFGVNQMTVQDTLLKDLIMRQLRQNKYNIKPMKQLFFIILNKLESILQSKNRNLFKAILNFMTRCNRFLVYKNLDIYHQETMWKIIRFISKNIQKINQINLSKETNYLFLCYLSKNYKHYSHSKNYSDMVSKLLQNLPNVSVNMSLRNVLYPAAITLQMLQAKHCTKQIVDKLDLNYTEKQKVKVILDQNYEGKLENLHKSNLYDINALVFNKNSIKLIEKNLPAILAKIHLYTDSQLIEILFTCNLPNNQITKKLLSKILKTFSDKNKNTQNFDMGRVFSRSIQGYYFLIQEYGKIFYRLMNNYLAYKGRIKYIDTNTLIQYARFAATQPEKKEMSNFYQVAREWLTINTLTNQMFLLATLLNTGFTFTDKHLELIPKAIQQYFKGGLKMLLYLQDRLPIQKRKELVRLVVSVMKNSTKDQIQRTIPDLFYYYLKKVYPQETKNLNLDHTRLNQFLFSSRPIPNVMKALQDVKSKLGLELKLHKNFGKNQVYEMNDTFIVFISPLRTSSIYQRRFLKKAIKVITNRKIPVLDFLNSSVKDQSIYLKLIKSKGVILSEEQIEELMRKSQAEIQVCREDEQWSQIKS